MKYIKTKQLLRFYFEDRPNEIIEIREIIKHLSKRNNKRGVTKENIKKQLKDLTKESIIYRYRKKYEYPKTYYSYKKIKQNSTFISFPVVTTGKW